MRRQNVAEERREAADVATEGSEDRAAAEYDVAVAQADGQRKVAKEKCETLGSDAQKACKDQAEATYESAKAQAQATLDAAKRRARLSRLRPDELGLKGTTQSRQGDAHLRDLHSRDCVTGRPAESNYSAGRPTLDAGGHHETRPI